MVKIPGPARSTQHGVFCPEEGGWGGRGVVCMSSTALGVCVFCLYISYLYLIFFNTYYTFSFSLNTPIVVPSFFFYFSSRVLPQPDSRLPCACHSHPKSKSFSSQKATRHPWSDSIPLYCHSYSFVNIFKERLLRAIDEMHMLERTWMFACKKIQISSRFLRV